ncbi:Arsenite methyltransferase [Galdieria sulphuraria]|nr:Arsenite methyltransferase [Galdieria sulphuraria]
MKLISFILSIVKHYKSTLLLFICLISTFNDCPVLVAANYSITVSYRNLKNIVIRMPRREKISSFYQKISSVCKERSFISTEQVAKYYKNVVTGNSRISCPCSSGILTSKQQEILSSIHPTILEKYYGCASPIPTAMEGCTVLDLGCGTGRDVYLCSALVGNKGKVIGVDLLPEMLEIASQYKSYHAEKFFQDSSQSNVQFLKGHIENLREIGIADGSIDIVISNCVVNLSDDKEKIFKEVARVLKPGGEFYFADKYIDRRLSAEARQDLELVGQCLGKAMYIQDFVSLVKKAGFSDIRLVSSSKERLSLETETKLNGASAYSCVFRAFRLEHLDECLEDYQETAIFHGATDVDRDTYQFDCNLKFLKDLPVSVDGNTAEIIRHSRLSRHFHVTDRKSHQGLFQPEKQLPMSLIVKNQCFEKK